MATMSGVGGSRVSAMRLLGRSIRGLSCWAAISLLLGACSAAEPQASTVEREAVASRSEALVLLPINAAADTSLRQATQYANDGTGVNLSVSSVASAEQRTLIRFDQATIASSIGSQSVYSAVVELTVTGISEGWAGGRLSIHPMTRTWQQGNGTFGPPGSQGPSWRCAHDTDTSTFGNLFNNCTTANLWGMNPGGDPVPFASTPTDTTPLYNNGTPVLRFDVTADVRRFMAGDPNHGWIVKDTAGSGHGAWVNFASRETLTPPRLVLDVGPDLCPNDSTKVAPGACGCGSADTDTDGDEQPDCLEPALRPVADTTLRLAVPYGNDGLGRKLEVTSASVAGLERSLIRFDQGQIAGTVGTGQLDWAELELTVQGIAVGWNGGAVELHRMTRSWPEGVGLDVSLGAHGPSWRCADDTNTSLAGLNSNDCLTSNRWGMEPWDPHPLPFDAAVTDSAPVFTLTTKKVVLDVTEDVRSFLSGTPNHGWMLKGAEGLLSGEWIDFGSRESEHAPVLRMGVQPPGTCTNVSCGALPPNPIDRRDSPVIVSGSRDHITSTDHPGSGSSSTPVDFKVPPYLRVVVGSAGNGTARLTYVTDTGANVTCTYRGRSTTPVAMSDLNRARSRFYYFVSCSNGLVAGAPTRGRAWNIHVDSADRTHPAGRTEVEAHFGPGCSDLLEAPISAEQSVTIRQSFSWRDTAPLPTTDVAGFPAMRYVWIYLENDQQIEALNEMGVHYSLRPIFAPDLERYLGKCGKFDYQGDGWGIFAHAIIPAALYNYLRQVALVSLERGSGTIPFRVIHLPPVPQPEVFNSDGTLSWQKMKESGFDYFDRPAPIQQPLFGVDIPIVDDAIEMVEHAVDMVAGLPVVGSGLGFVVQVGENAVATTISMAPTYDEIIEFGANVVETAWEVGTDIVGEIEKFLLGSVVIDIRVSVLNRDPAFDRNAPMIRGWGPRAGQELTLHGNTVWVLKWSEAVIPSSFHGTLTDDGMVRMRVAKKGSQRGGGICLELENAAGIMSSGYTEDEFCDFREADGSDLNFHGFERSFRMDLRTNDHELHALNQVTDGHDFVRSVMGHNPPQADISSGVVDSIVAGDSANTLCLNFPGTMPVLDGVIASTVAIPAVGPAGLMAAPLVRKDIFIGRGEARDSRGIMTHEYGHFVSCSMVFDHSPGALGRLLEERLFEGDPEDHNRVAMMLESFADFFASQVVSGTNYARLPNALRLPEDSGSDMSYCTAADCLEHNFRGNGDAVADARFAFHDEVAKFVTLFHDVFDRPAGSTWRTDGSLPVNGDAWAPGATLTFSPADYQTDVDDDIARPGGFLGRWVNEWLGDCTEPLGAPDPDCNFSVDAAVFALDRQLEQDGVDWCDRCVLFAQHDESAAAIAATTLIDQWRACRDVGTLQGIVGPPPTPSLSIDAATCTACPFQNRSDNGVCVPCAADEISRDNQCVACAPGTAPSLVAGIEVCSPCDVNSVSVNGLCVNCANHQVADRATNLCIDCAVDEVVDFSMATTGDCRFSDEALTPATFGPPESCEAVYIIEYINMDAIFACSLPAAFLRASSNAPNEAVCEGAATTFTVDTRSPPGPWSFRSGLTQTGQWSCTPGPIFPCTEPCFLRFQDDFSSSVIASQARSIRVAIRQGASLSVRMSAGQGPPPQ